MKKLFKILGISFLTCFSFYYTDKVIDISKNKDPIMIKIIEFSDENNILPVSSIVNDNTLEVGSMGIVVDIEESYRKMKKLGKFDESLIVYKEVYEESIKDSLDKYIVKSNTNSYLVSLVIVLENNNYIDDVLDILKNNEIYTTFFIKDLDEEIISKISSFGHNIGIVSDSKKSLSIINKYNSNNSYCYTSSSNDSLLDECNKLKLNTILKEKIDKNLFYNIKNNLNKGEIIPVSNNVLNLKELDLSIKYIKQKGYVIVDLDNLFNNI